MMDGMDDSWIGTAATNISLHGIFDFLIGRAGIFIHQSNGSDDHARGTITALKNIRLQKCLLYLMKFPVLFQTFHSNDFFTLKAGNRGNARRQGRTVHQYLTCPADPFPTTIFGSGKIQLFP